MSKKKDKPARLRARLPKGLRDTGPGDIRRQQAMLERIRAVYESYGFEPLETPAFEYTDALGKFLPDEDRPNEGVFSFQDEDEQWLSLRYDLTAPLARYVAENFNDLPKPFRRYQCGPVWRNEKPGPGRFRQFLQFDADTVGAPTVAADAEMCMMAADTLEALGIRRGDYVIKVNNRKVLDGVLESVGVTDERQKLTVLRALDKYDRLGEEGVRLLLGPGRKDRSGDFTKGARLSGEQIQRILNFCDPDNFQTSDYGGSLQKDPCKTIRFFQSLFDAPTYQQGLSELEEIAKLIVSGDYGPKRFFSGRIHIDPSVVRGLEYYTGPVFEAELTFAVKSKEGGRFGSVGGGGRYDDLVARFTGQAVPATGFSIGVSRLAAALEALGKLEEAAAPGPVVVTVFDRDSAADSQKLVARLRAAGIRAEMYLGNPKTMGAQFKYADQRGSPCVVIQGPDEKEKGEVQVKDLVEGAWLSAEIADNVQWRESRPAQFAVAEDELVEAVRGVLDRRRA